MYKQIYAVNHLERIMVLELNFSIFILKQLLTALTFNIDLKSDPVACLRKAFLTFKGYKSYYYLAYE